MKTTYRSPTGKSPIRNLSLDPDDQPFQRLQHELSQVESRYNKMEVVIKRASKLLGDCKAGNLCKELKKLKEQGTKELEATNLKLLSQVADLKVDLSFRDEEIRRLKEHKTEQLEKIRAAISCPGDVWIKARLIDEELKTEGHLSAQKILTILVKYGRKMDAVLEDMRKLLPGTSPTGMTTSGPSTAGPSQPPAGTSVAAASPKSPHPLLEALQARLQ